MTATPFLLPPQGDGLLLRKVFGCFPRGVTAVCADVDGRPVGMAASSFTSVSLDPPLVAVCVQNSSQTWPRLRSTAGIGLSVLADGQDGTCRSLADKDSDRFAGFGWARTDSGAIFVDGAAALLDCTLYDEVPAGDHAIVLLRVQQVYADLDTAPLVFHRSQFRRLAEI